MDDNDIVIVVARHRYGAGALRHGGDETYQQDQAGLEARQTRPPLAGGPGGGMGRGGTAWRKPSTIKQKPLAPESKSTPASSCSSSSVSSTVYFAQKQQLSHYIRKRPVNTVKHYILY